MVRMRVSFLVVASLALVWVGTMSSSKANQSNSRCHSSIFLPLDPLVAAKTFEQAVKSNPVSAEAHRELGSAYLALFDRSELAQHEFHEVVRLDPSSAAGYAGLGWSYVNSATTSLHRSLQRHYSESQLQLFTQAIDFFDRALSLDPHDASALL